jgi:ribose transport system substrate-binding protein
VLSAAGITAGLAACGVASSSSVAKTAASGSKTGLITRGKSFCQVTTLSNDFFGAFNDGAKQFSSALGLDMTTFEDNANVNTALGQVGNVKTAGSKMLFGTPATEAEAAAVTKACQSAGIYYGSAYTAPPFYTPADADHWARFVTPPSINIAYQTAKALFQKVNGEGTIIHVPGQKGSSADSQRTAGFTKALAEFPKIKVVTTAPGNWISADARTAFANALPSVRDFVGVFAQNDSEAAGVISVLDAKGIKGKIVTGFDGNKQNIQYIADGKQYYTSASIGGLTAAIVGVAVFDAMNGVKLSLPERFMFQGAVPVMADSASTFLTSVYGATLPFNWELMSQALHPKDWDPQTLLNPIDPTTFFEGQTPGAYQLNSAWASAAGDIATVQQKYSAAFKSGPLFPYKAQMVA